MHKKQGLGTISEAKRMQTHMNMTQRAVFSLVVISRRTNPAIITNSLSYPFLTRMATLFLTTYANEFTAGANFFTLWDIVPVRTKCNHMILPQTWWTSHVTNSCRRACTSIQRTMRVLQQGTAKGWTGDRPPKLPQNPVLASPIELKIPHTENPSGNGSP